MGDIGNGLHNELREMGDAFGKLAEDIRSHEAHLKADGAAAERAAVVAYLRHEAVEWYGDVKNALISAANRIERGEHLPKRGEGSDD